MSHQGVLARVPAPMAVVIGLAALLAAAGVQRYVEERRIETKLTWTNTEDKQALEVGFLALGGFRGLLADVLWFKAQTQQDTAHYYELKLLCELIQKLQPTFTQVHAFQAYNMSYNIADHAQNCEDKWYWIRSGIATLEKGLERTRQNYNLWFELGMQYFDRLGDTKMQNCVEIRDRELPNIDELTEEQCDAVFSKPKTWVSGHARKDENIRFAAYYFWKSLETHTEKNPLRTERIYGLCLQHLGLWYTQKPVSEWKKWSDGASEPWFVELLKRNKERGMDYDLTVAEHLRACMYEMIYRYKSLEQQAAQRGDLKTAAEYRKLAEDAHQRYAGYLPNDHVSIDDILKQFAEQRARTQRMGGR